MRLTSVFWPDFEMVILSNKKRTFGDIPKLYGVLGFLIEVTFNLGSGSGQPHNLPHPSNLVY